MGGEGRHPTAAGEGRQAGAQWPGAAVKWPGRNAAGSHCFASVSAKQCMGGATAADGRGGAGRRRLRCGTSTSMQPGPLGFTSRSRAIALFVGFLRAKQAGRPPTAVITRSFSRLNGRSRAVLRVATKKGDVELKRRQIKKRPGGSEETSLLTFSRRLYWERSSNLLFSYRQQPVERASFQAFEL